MIKHAIYQLPLIGDEFDIRKELLLFDKIYIPETLIKQKTSSYVNIGHEDKIEPMYSELEFLVKCGLVEIIDIKKIIHQQLAKIEDTDRIMRMAEGLSESEKEKVVKRLLYYNQKGNFIDHFVKMRPELRNDIDSNSNDENIGKKIWLYQALREKYDGSAIEYAAGLMDFFDEDKEVIPIRASYVNNLFHVNTQSLSIFNTINSNELSSFCDENIKQSVAKVLLKKMPIPNKEVPLERILDFKSNSDNTRKLRDLNHWMRKLGNTDISPRELEEEIDYLFNEYKRLFELNRMKYSYTETQIILNTALGTLEKLVKIKWGELASSFFEVKKAKIDLELAESQIVGRELAYLVSVEKSLKE